MISGLLWNQSILLITNPPWFSSTIQRTVVKTTSTSISAVGWPWLNRLVATLNPIANHLCCSHHQDRRSHPHWPQNSHPDWTGQKSLLGGNNSVSSGSAPFLVGNIADLKGGSPSFLKKNIPKSRRDSHLLTIPTTPFGYWKCRLWILRFLLGYPRKRSTLRPFWDRHYLGNP